MFDLIEEVYHLSAYLFASFIVLKFLLFRSVVDFRIVIRERKSRLRSENRGARFIGIGAGHNRDKSPLRIERIAIYFRKTFDRILFRGIKNGINRIIYTASRIYYVESGFLQRFDSSRIKGGSFGAAGKRVDPGHVKVLGSGLRPALSEMTPPRIMGADEDEIDRLSGSKFFRDIIG